MKEVSPDNSKREIEISKWKISHEFGILASPEGKSLLLEPRLSKLLYFLGLNANEIVSRDYLANNIWKDTIVNEESLTRAIADLRKALSKNFNKAIEIDTIRKRGYKLVLNKEPKVKVHALKLKIKDPLRHLVLGLVLIMLALLWFMVK